MLGDSQEETVNQWGTVLWGIIALAVGLLLVAQPAITAFFLVQVMGTLWLIGGIVDLVVALVDRGGRQQFLRIIDGVVAIIAGLILLGNPFVGGVLVVLFQFYIIAFAAIINGIINIIGRFQGVSGWGRFVLGIVQLVIGIFFVFNPIPMALALIPIFGIAVALGGLITIAAAFFLRPTEASARRAV